MTTKTETKTPDAALRFFMRPVKPGPCKVPAGALRFEAGPCEFGEAADGSRNVPVKITARTGQPIDHWYWGKIVHDLAGMKVHKKALPIDYAHYDDEVLGYVDKFETGSGDLVVAGELVPFGENDRASEVTHKAQNGVPYEASIFFTGPLVLEELGEGTSAEVNGYELKGPAVIIRQCNLRGVAVCPYGMDRNTKTQLKAGDADVPITIVIEENAPMAEKPNSQTTDPDPKQLSDAAQPSEKPGDAGKQTPPPLPGKQADKPPEQPADDAGKQGGPDDPRAECKRFLAAFGPQGATWFAEGKPFSEAQQLHADGQAEQIGVLKKKLAAANLGEEDPVSFQAADTPAGQGAVSPQLVSVLGENLGRFAASIKLPNRNGRA
ncbi:MAG TPA: hypothetical protein VM238_16995 [Phycisphaerae bacterium]|nr:hypothetical protein [Phycisphaerae bacterium]HUX16385.1 hypothetical protein [Phycisphaerae bacterium]